MIGYDRLLHVILLLVVIVAAWHLALAEALYRFLMLLLESK